MFDLEFWKNRKVFITGHTGFKGSWMLCVLKYLNAKVYGYALESEAKPNMYEIISGDNLCKSVIGDVRDYDKLCGALTESGAEIVIHMAAQPLVIEGYKNPKETYETNVMGTVNILEAVKNCESVKGFLNVTTDKVYENVNKNTGYIETDRLGGFDPYSGSKACSELITLSYRQSFFNVDSFKSHNKVIGTARAGNVLGGGDWAENRIIPDCVKAAFGNFEILIRNKNAVRPWQHVLEPVCGYLKFTEYMVKYGKDYSISLNFGPNETDCKTVGEIVKIFSERWGGLNYKFTDAHYYEAGLLKLDSTLAGKKLNWNGKYHVKKAISTIVDWVKAYKDKSDMQKFTIRQIEEYLKS